jgi:protein-S-isoprenylcysteine O-methyltransferase Ste14
VGLFPIVERARIARRLWYCSSLVGKEGTVLTNKGLLLVTIGQIARSLAMAHAGTNFNHVVQNTREQDHVLVKTGIYRYGYYTWSLIRLQY